MDGAPRVRFSRATEVVRAYDTVAGEYARSYSGDPVAAAEDKMVLGQLRAGGYLVGDVLDLGCGAGMLVGLGGLSQFRYVGVDPSERMLEEARRRHPEHSFRLGSSGFIPVVRQSFDSVVALYGVLSYFEHLEVAGIELARVVRPGGRLFLMGYGRGRPRSKRRYHAGEAGAGNPPVFPIRRLGDLMGEDFVAERVWGMSKLVDYAPSWAVPTVLKLDVLLSGVDPGAFNYVVVEARRI